MTGKHPLYRRACELMLALVPQRVHGQALFETGLQDWQIPASRHCSVMLQSSD